MLANAEPLGFEYELKMPECRDIMVGADGFDAREVDPVRLCKARQAWISRVGTIQKRGVPWLDPAIAQWTVLFQRNGYSVIVEILSSDDNTEVYLVECSNDIDPPTNRILRSLKTIASQVLEAESRYRREGASREGQGKRRSNILAPPQTWILGQ